MGRDLEGFLKGLCASELWVGQLPCALKSDVSGVRKQSILWQVTSFCPKQCCHRICPYLPLSLFFSLNIMTCFDTRSVLGVFSCPSSSYLRRHPKTIAFLLLGCMFFCPLRQQPSFLCIQVAEDEPGVERARMPWCVRLRMGAALLSYLFGWSSGRPPEFRRWALNSLS